jgi:hypothetical protein
LSRSRRKRSEAVTSAWCDQAQFRFVNGTGDPMACKPLVEVPTSPDWLRCSRRA